MTCTHEAVKAQREEQNKLCAVQVCSETRAKRAAWCMIPTWQPNPAEVAEDELEGIARVDCVEQSGVPDVEPRGHRVSPIVHREVECVRCRDSGDCDGCSEARDSAATRSNTEGCRWCIGCRECRPWATTWVSRSCRRQSSVEK